MKRGGTLSIMTHLCAAFIMMLCMMVIWGWVIHEPLLVQVRPSFAPMMQSVPHFGHSAVCPSPPHSSVHSMISNDWKTRPQSKQPQSLLARISSRWWEEWRWARISSGVGIPASYHAVSFAQSISANSNRLFHPQYVNRYCASRPPTNEWAGIMTLAATNSR
jgi:hypothetical protein